MDKHNQKPERCRICRRIATDEPKAAALTLGTQDGSYGLAWVICGTCWKKYGPGLAFTLGNSLDIAMKCEAVEREVREAAEDDELPPSHPGAMQ